MCMPLYHNIPWSWYYLKRWYVSSHVIIIVISTTCKHIKLSWLLWFKLQSGHNVQFWLTEWLSEDNRRHLGIPTKILKRKRERREKFFDGTQYHFYQNKALGPEVSHFFLANHFSLQAFCFLFICRDLFESQKSNANVGLKVSTKLI